MAIPPPRPLYTLIRSAAGRIAALPQPDAAAGVAAHRRRKREGWRWGRSDWPPELAVDQSVDHHRAGVVGCWGAPLLGRLWRSYGLAAVAFVLGSLPWCCTICATTGRRGLSSLRLRTPGARRSPPPSARWAGGLGLRRSTAGASRPPPVFAVVRIIADPAALLILLIDFLITLRAACGRSDRPPARRGVGLAGVRLFALIFLASSFFDTTGATRCRSGPRRRSGWRGHRRLRRSGPALSAIALGLLRRFRVGRWSA